jgi:hypothetical protein
MFITIENNKMKILILPAEVILSEGMKEEKIERKRLRYLRASPVISHTLSAFFLTDSMYNFIFQLYTTRISCILLITSKSFSRTKSKGYIYFFKSQIAES